MPRNNGNFRINDRLYDDGASAAYDGGAGAPYDGKIGALKLYDSIFFE